MSRKPSCSPRPFRATWLSAALGALAAFPAGAQICSETPPAIVANGFPSGCTLCDFTQLPGANETNPATTWFISSDLPERFTTPGVLYANVPVLPNNGTPTAMRTQTASGSFNGYIDGNFDVALFHLTSPGDGSAPRRITIYVKNEGTGSVTVTPKQVFSSDGVIGTVHDLENVVSQRTISGSWDTPVGATNLAAGAGNIVGYGKQFATPFSDTDRSKGTTCVGRVRVTVSNPNAGANPTRLRVYVVGIAGASVSQNKTATEALLNTGATNGEQSVNLNVPPSGCELRRAVGVFPSPVWRANDPATIDLNTMSSGGIMYQMALSDLQTGGNCPGARQTSAMSYSPAYARPDSVGNFFTEHRVQFRLINTSPTDTKVFDCGFTKADGDVGLVWKVAKGTGTQADATVDAAPTRTKWTGPNQTAVRASFLTSDGGPVTVPPCSQQYVHLRFQIIADSSLPFQLYVTGSDIVDNANASVAGSWTTGNVATDKYAGSYAYKSQGTGTGTYQFTPSLATGGEYNVYEWHPVGSNRTVGAPHVVNHSGGMATVNVNQALAGGQWNLLGNWNFAAGNAGSVKITDAFADAGKIVMADALKFEYTIPDIIIDNPAATVVGAWGAGSAQADKYGADYRFIGPGTGSNYVQYNPTIATPGYYKVYEWHQAAANRPTAAQIIVNGAGGGAFKSANQTINGGQWNLVGTFSLKAGTGNYVRITDNFTGAAFVGADAVKFVYVK